MQITRRRFLQWGAAGAAALALPLARAYDVIAGGTADEVTSPPVGRFAVPLVFSPVIDLASPGTPNFTQIVQTIAQQQVLPGLPPTTIWGYNGIWPGPTILTRRGKPVTVRHINQLAVSTTVHHHGADELPIDDGHPLNLIQAGNGPKVSARPGDVLVPEASNVKDYHYPNIQPAITMWYHDHAIDATGRNVYMGLSAFQPCTDEVEDALPLPKGLAGLAPVPYDIPLCIQDRAFNKDGSFFFGTDDANIPLRQGNFGDVLLVNGVPFPFFQVANRKYRFRMLNGCNSRFLQIALSTGEPLTMIGTDGGLTAQAAETPDFVIGPSMRYEFVIDFSKYRIGTQIVMLNTFEPGAFGDPTPPEKVSQIMRFDVVADVADPSSIPADLAPVAVPLESSAVRTRDWEFNRDGGAWTINGHSYGRDRIDATVRSGDTEIWRFINKSGGWIHPIHPHLIEGFILDRNGQPPFPYERGPKDAFFLGTGETVRVIMTFEHFKGVFVMHCHNLAHEDHEMMTQFEVV